MSPGGPDDICTVSPSICHWKIESHHIDHSTNRIISSEFADSWDDHTCESCSKLIWFPHTLNWYSLNFNCSRSTTSTTTTTEPSIVEEEDPCQEGNHIVIADEPERSANHHLSLGAISSPICDRTILAGWYRFQSPAGNLIPTECPGENYCGTRKPVWLNGKRHLLTWKSYFWLSTTLSKRSWQFMASSTL